MKQGLGEPITADLVRLDDPAFYEKDPFPIYRRLRHEAPVFHYEPLNLWIVSKYHDIRHIGSSPEIFSSESGIVINELKYDQTALKSLFPPGCESLPVTDPPRHRQLRKIISIAFTPRMVQHLEPRIREVAAHLIEQVKADEPFDLIDDLAAPFPMIVICDLLGIPSDNLDDLQRWANDTMTIASGLEENEFQAVLQDLMMSYGYIGQHLEQRRGCPADDLLSRLLDAELDGEKLNDITALMFSQLLLTAGGETSKHLIAGALMALAEHGDQARVLAEDPVGLAPRATEEFLRWVTPANGFHRTVREDTEIRGQQIKAGQHVYMLYPSGNRDEEIWENPDELDVTRPTEPAHLSFGFGEHMCLGAALSRLETRIFFEELMTRFGSFEMAGAPTRAPSTLMNAWATVPMIFRAR